MREIEVRALWQGTVTDAHRVLSEKGYAKGPTQRQVDYLFDRPDASLFKSGRKIRLRETNGEYWLTYKSSLAGSPETSDRTEVNIPLPAASVDDARYFLSEIGYPPLCVLPKIRHQYAKQEVTVTVDEWPLIGTLMEIEGPSESIVQGVATDIAPSLRFRNYRLRELLELVLERSGTTFSYAQAAAEEQWGMALGRLDLALGWGR